MYYLTTLNTLKLLIQLCQLILTLILLIHKNKIKKYCILLQISLCYLFKRTLTLSTVKLGRLYMK